MRLASTAKLAKSEESMEGAILASGILVYKCIKVTVLGESGYVGVLFHSRRGENAVPEIFHQSNMVKTVKQIYQRKSMKETARNITRCLPAGCFDSMNFSVK
jgi:hypothetical protein